MDYSKNHRNHETIHGTIISSTPPDNIERIEPSILQSECRLFIAESSIPNGGMSIFSGVDIDEFGKIEKSHEIGIP